MLEVVEMFHGHDDVSVDVTAFEGGVLEGYNHIKDLAVSAAETFEKRTGRKCLVDMGRSDEGYPCADLYTENMVFQKFFITNNEFRDMEILKPDEF